MIGRQLRRDMRRFIVKCMADRAESKPWPEGGESIPGRDAVLDGLLHQLVELDQTRFRTELLSFVRLRPQILADHLMRTRAIVFKIGLFDLLNPEIGEEFYHRYNEIMEANRIAQSQIGILPRVMKFLRSED